MTICEIYGDNEDCEDEDYEDEEGDEEGDDESERDGDVQANDNVLSFLNLHQLMENEQRRYVSVDVGVCNVSNNTDLKDAI